MGPVPIKGYVSGTGRKRRLYVMAACYELSLRRERFDAKEATSLQFEPWFRRRYAGILGYSVLQFKQIYRLMSTAPYLLEDGEWEGTTKYRLDPKWADKVQQELQDFIQSG